MYQPVNELSRVLWLRGRKRKERMQLRLWNLNSVSNSPLAPCRLSCQVSAYQQEAETSANVKKHGKPRPEGNDVIINVISANQHFALTFSIQRSCYLSFLSPAPPPECAGELACRLVMYKLKYTQRCEVFPVLFNMSHRSFKSDESYENIEQEREQKKLEREKGG